MKLQKTALMIILSILSLSLYGSGKIVVNSKTGSTTIRVIIPEQLVPIDAMIYGQMLEDCNDNVIYGGLIKKDGNENLLVSEMLKPLNMPIVRWPAGTYIHEYDWENGIGPKENRPTIPCVCWGGEDSHLFGTDEFLQWCDKMKTIPYINFNMSNHPKYAASLGDALNWIEYVNGSTKTAFGMKRAANGHPEPYHVKHWCIGNENYGSYGVHKAETAEAYSKKLHEWASCIKQLHPDLHLLGVGHLYDWNQTVLEENGKLIDFLTLHYYMKANIKNDILINQQQNIFSPASVEANIQKNAGLLDQINRQLGRTNNPIRFSIDEWNNRHSVFNGDKFEFTRKDDRRLFDVTTVAGMLNVFIRQSPAVGMANYIFPINGHGLLKTVGEEDAYKTPVYYVFELYRQHMIGKKLDLNIEGPGISIPLKDLSVEGDINKEVVSETSSLAFVDGSAVITEDGKINVALVNRSHDKTQKIKIDLPDDYLPKRIWTLENDDINAKNTKDNRINIIPQNKELSKKISTVSIKPCSFLLIQYEK